MRKFPFFWNTGNFSHSFSNTQTLSLPPLHSREKAAVHGRHQILSPGESLPRHRPTSSLKTSPSPHHLGPQSTPSRASSVLRYMLVYPLPLPRPSLPVRRCQSPLFLSLENVDQRALSLLETQISTGLWVLPWAGATITSGILSPVAPLPCQLPTCLAAALPAMLPPTSATSAQSDTHVPPMTEVSSVEGLGVHKEKLFPLTTTWQLARLSRLPGRNVLHYQTLESGFFLAIFQSLKTERKWGWRGREIPSWSSG